VFFTCFSLFFEWAWTHVVIFCLVGVSSPTFERW